MKKYKITLCSDNQSSSFDIDLSESEYSLMKDIEKATKKLMVGLYIRQSKKEKI